MKISVTVTVDIDPQQWANTFGVEGDRAIRADVKSYIGAGVSDMGAFGSGEIKLNDLDWK